MPSPFKDARSPPPGQEFPGETLEFYEAKIAFMVRSLLAKQFLNEDEGEEVTGITQDEFIHLCCYSEPLRFDDLLDKVRPEFPRKLGKS